MHFAGWTSFVLLTVSHFALKDMIYLAVGTEDKACIEVINYILGGFRYVVMMISSRKSGWTVINNVVSNESILFVPKNGSNPGRFVFLQWEKAFNLSTGRLQQEVNQRICGALF